MSTFAAAGSLSDVCRGRNPPPRRRRHRQSVRFPLARRAAGGRQQMPRSDCKDDRTDAPRSVRRQIICIGSCCFMTGLSMCTLLECRNETCNLAFNFLADRCTELRQHRPGFKPSPFLCKSCDRQPAHHRNTLFRPFSTISPVFPAVRTSSAVGAMTVCGASLGYCCPVCGSIACKDAFANQSSVMR